MMKIAAKHLLTGEELSRSELLGLLDLAIELKKERRAGKNRTDLLGKTLALLFEKPSLRTHISFSVAMQELGGNIVETFASIRKKEEPEDVARVLSGYCHAVMIRTFEHKILDRMSEYSSIPLINGLSDSHHPCQILADLMTLKERYGKLEGLKIAYLGDGNNILHSLLLLAPLVGVEVRYAAPSGYEPNAFIVKKAKSRAKEGGAAIAGFNDVNEAVRGVHAVYTDVWTSMGFEKEEAEREKAFEGYQVNEELMAQAAPGALFMHCMPMARGKEVSETLPDSPCSAIFQQSENRLHAQKAVLLGLVRQD